MDGGFRFLRVPLVRKGIHAHTAALADPFATDLSLHAANAVSATAWRINGWVLDVMREAWLAGDVIGKLPSPDDLPLPGRVDAAAWEALTSKERAEHKAARACVHGENARLQSKREAILRVLDLARELAGRRLWFAHGFDFRGRMYPFAQDLHPQGADPARSLLMFDRGLPLGQSGAYWLCVALANAAGQDKLPLDERVAWTLGNEPLLLDSARNPLDGERFWTTFDEPWLGLALCREFAEYQQYGPDAVSHVPICVDATCSGIQHLSALVLDVDGARAVNLSADDQRHDLYSAVAEVCKRLAAEDAAGADDLAARELAAEWLGKIERKTVKRAVMTTPYGVTFRGMRDQFVDDRHIEWAEAGRRHKLAEYLAGVVRRAMEETARAAKDVMAYLQDTAKVLAEEELPFCWTTPAGFRVQQAYWNTRQVRLTTLIGEITLRKAQAYTTEEEPGLGLNIRKQALASAPNFIHSFDAAHLALTVTSCVTCHPSAPWSFATVHDSFGCPASLVDTMQEVLRQQFVRMYDADRLALLEEEIRAYAPSVELPERPARGGFDIAEVLGAPYFFS